MWPSRSASLLPGCSIQTLIAPVSLICKHAWRIKLYSTMFRPAGLFDRFMAWWGTVLNPIVAEQVSVTRSRENPRHVLANNADVVNVIVGDQIENRMLQVRPQET